MSQKQKYINCSWQECKLSDIVIFQRGRDLVQSDFIKGDFPVAGSNGIINYHNIYTTIGPGITLGRSGNSIGVAHYYESNFWAHNTVLYSKEFNKSFPKFVYYLLKTLDLKSFDSGSAVPSLNRNYIHGININLPSLPEQKAIAAVLSSFDDKIELLRRQNQTLEAIAQTIFKEWFVHFKINGKKLKLNPQTNLPEGWRMGRLEDVIEIRNGFAFKSEDYVESGVTIVRTTNFVDGSIVLDDVVYLTEEKAKEFEKFYLSKFDFLLVMVGASLGKSVITPSYVLPALQNQNMWNFKAKDGLMKFYNMLFLGVLVSQQINSAGGSARDFFRKDHFYSLDITIPEANILHIFNRLVSDVFEKIDLNISQIQTLSKLRDTLLPKLMKGEIRVNEMSKLVKGESNDN